MAKGLVWVCPVCGQTETPDDDEDFVHVCPGSKKDKK